MQNRMVKVTLVTLLSFAIYFALDEAFFRTFRTWLNTYINQIGISHLITYTVFGFPLFIATLWLHERSSFFNSLGLDQSITKAFIFALICTLPMFIGFAFVFEFNHNLTLTILLISVLAAAFFEELYFRAFLFGQLFRYTRLGFLPSVLIGALLFGFVHLYQSNDMGELIGIFLVTFSGGILFAWVYTEWDYNLWVPIFLHLLMNLSWEMFSVSENAFGGAYSNIFRMITIALIILLTIFYKKRKRQSLEVNRRTVWKKQAIQSKI